jgi:hypothetical protein
MHSMNIHGVKCHRTGRREVYTNHIRKGISRTPIRIANFM